ncbi:MAG: SOS response-associated peptidase [Parvibaculum sp.]
MTETQAFRETFRRRHCLIPATGYCEWEQIDSRTKQPWRIVPGGEPIFAFAGRWERRDKSDEPIESYTIIVGEANMLSAPIHDRMPVILDQADWNTWLDAADIEAAKALLRPWPTERMRRYQVDRHVGKVKNDDPSLIQPIDTAA